MSMSLMGVVPKTAKVMAQKIQSMPKAKVGTPGAYRSYQTKKVKAPIRLRGKKARSLVPKGLTNPYDQGNT